MCQISKILFDFAVRTGSHDVLNNPQDFLGPNTDKLLKFWSFLDELTKDQWKTIETRYRSFYVYQNLEWCKAATEANKASRETIGKEFAYGNAAAASWDAYGNVACYATQESIGGVKNPVFIPMFNDV